MYKFGTAFAVKNQKLEKNYDNDVPKEIKLLLLYYAKSRNKKLKGPPPSIQFNPASFPENLRKNFNSYTEIQQIWQDHYFPNGCRFSARTTSLWYIYTWDLLGVNYCVKYSLKIGLYFTKRAHSNLPFGQLLHGLKSLIIGLCTHFSQFYGLKSS